MVRSGPTVQERPTASSRLPPGLAALAFRDYRLLWSGMVLISALMPLQFITQLLYLQDAAPPHLRLVLAGVLSAARGVAMLTVGLVGGALADRIDRRRLLIGAHVLGTASGVGIAVLMLAGLGGLGGIALLFVLVFLTGGAIAIDQPARQALVPQLVPRDQLGNAIALDSLAMQMAFPVALPVTGLLIARFGSGGAYLVAIAVHVAILVTALRMRSPGIVARVGGASLLSNIRDGVGYARRAPVVLWLLLLLFAVMAIGFPPVANLGPVWVTQVLGLSPGRFGFFAATWGIGGIAAAVALTNMRPFARQGWLVVIGAVGFCLFVVAWGYSRSVPLSAFINFSLGAFFTLTFANIRALIQRTTPHEVQGRVMSLFALHQAVSQVMTAPIGALAQALTQETLFPLLGWLSLALIGLIVAVRPEIRRAGHG
ncbi:MAG: MFS transporter [Dehalococcoidia bacterium]